MDGAYSLSPSQLDESITPTCAPNTTSGLSFRCMLQCWLISDKHHNRDSRPAIERNHKKLSKTIKILSKHHFQSQKAVLVCPCWVVNPKHLCLCARPSMVSSLTDRKLVTDDFLAGVWIQLRSECLDGMQFPWCFMISSALLDPSVFFEPSSLSMNLWNYNCLHKLLISL